MARPTVRKTARKKWMLLALAVLLPAAVLLLWQQRAQGTEGLLIQAMIEEMPAYQSEIESWGYKVSVLPKMDEEPDDPGFLRYYWASAGPVLVLEAPDGGRYCFYNGFDQYIGEKTYRETMMLFPTSQYAPKEYEEVLKTVRLQVGKREIGQEALLENTAEAGSPAHYDAFVRIEIRAAGLESGEEVSVFGDGFFRTNYCSSNFEECRWWSGIDPESANRYADHAIKQEYTAEQLLGYYRQGLALQSRLAGLYRERQGRA